jgi:hypothetical protein
MSIVYTFTLWYWRFQMFAYLHLLGALMWVCKSCQNSGYGVCWRKLNAVILHPNSVLQGAVLEFLSTYRYLSVGLWLFVYLSLNCIFYILTSLTCECTHCIREIFVFWVPLHLWLCFDVWAMCAATALLLEQIL